MSLYRFCVNELKPVRSFTYKFNIILSSTRLSCLFWDFLSVLRLTQNNKIALKKSKRIKMSNMFSCERSVFLIVALQGKTKTLDSL